MLRVVKRVVVEKLVVVLTQVEKLVVDYQQFKIKKPLRFIKFLRGLLVL
jgi:hypothetical protein